VTAATSPRFVAALAAMAALALLGAASDVGAAPPRWIQVAPAVEHAESMRLLILEAGPDGISLRGENRAAGRPKRQLGAPTGRGRLFQLLDGQGRQVLLGEVEIPELLHGPILGEDGEIRCRAFPQERVTFVLKIPDLPDVETIEFLTRSSPRSADGRPTLSVSSRIALPPATEPR
jgi:hypothetical protein